MVDEFVHLHAHSEFSLLDGLGRVNDLVTAAADSGMPALALTDHGTMFGAIEFYEKARGAGIKPILGCEVYVSDRPLAEKAGSGAHNYHLVLLAENEAGYRNLIKLSTEAHLRGFYRKPRVDRALLEAHSEGLICLSACANGEVAQAIQRGNLPEAEAIADWYHQVFQDRYYLELQYHELAFQRDVNQGVVHLSQRLGLPLVATNDVHYVQERHARTHEILLCIQTQTTMSDPKRMKLETQEFYLKSGEQMRALFGDYPGAISNTRLIADRCNLDLTFGRPQLPHFDTPLGQSSEAYLRSLCDEGLRIRYPQNDEPARARLDYELGVILSTGFVDYFLLVHDVIAFARNRGIAVGPGRGSAAGSIVAYVLFLTSIDPLEHGLSFERFLNPERVSMPDMDLDFADDRRDEVIAYVTEKYGRERVAQIITFGTMKSRAGVRDVGRCLGMPYADVDRVAKLIPLLCPSLAKAKEEVVELQLLYESDAQIKEMLDAVSDLEGVARHASTHAAGVVIARDPLTEHVPLYKVPKSDQVTTQYPMASIEKIGLLKMDFLGLRTLTVLQRAQEFVLRATGVEPDVNSISLADSSIYELLSSGETFGVFQVDGAGMRRLLRDLNPTEFKHIVALIALYRPGPMDQIDEFVARKNGLHPVEYHHPALEPVLEETYGIVVYQEQVMRMAVGVAGYSMGEADLLRKAMAKKKPEELAKHRATFIERASSRGAAKATAERLFDIIEPFAGYGFNKAHAAAYAMVTCQTAYLKANYPREYMAGLLSAERENAERVADAMAECRRLGIRIYPPDINRSYNDFGLEEEGIRFGLSAVKHAGSGAIESLVQTREEGGPFRSLEDFCVRVDWNTVNKRVFDSLVRCGAFDCLNVERGKLVANLDRVVSFGQNLQREQARGQTSLFGESDLAPAALQLALSDPVSQETKLEWERELLGIYVSPHPLTRAEDALRECKALLVGELLPQHHGQRLAVGGMIGSVRAFSTKDGRPMASFQLGGLSTTLEILVFSRAYEKLRPKITEGTLAIVEGKVDVPGDGQIRLLADAIFTLSEAQERTNSSWTVPATAGTVLGTESVRPTAMNEPKTAAKSFASPNYRLTIELERNGNRAEDISHIVELYAVLQRYRGQDDLEIVVRTGTRRESVPLPNNKVQVCEQLEKELSAMVSHGTWKATRLRPDA